MAKGRRTSMKRGGGGAAEYAFNAYGGFDQKAGGADQVIAVNAPKCMQGGRRKQNRNNTYGKTHAKLGGTTLLDIAVPAALFAANQAYRPRSTVAFRRGSRRNKFNRTRRMSRKHRG
jgi:hypothetical protein